MKREILEFHYEEIVYVLMILATDLKAYSKDDLKTFAEAIHRLDTLSKPKFLRGLKMINPKIDDDIVLNLVDLHLRVSELYAGQWYKALAKGGSMLDKISLSSKQLLNKLDEGYIEPVKYAEENMDVKW